jgi:hypothetical protein
LFKDNGEGGDLLPVTTEEQINLETVRLFTDVVKSKLYKFSYRVQNVNGWSPMSDVVMIRAAIMPSKPMGPLLLEATASEMRLKLFKPEDNGGSEIISFELFRNDGDSKTEPNIKVETYNFNLLEHTLTTVDDGLQTGTIYKFHFRATNDVGESQDSNIVQYALVDVPVAP